MYQILEKNNIASNIFRFVILAPDISSKAQQGQFIIIRLDETGERIPLTISDMDPEKGMLTIFVQAIGKTSMEMSRMNEGDMILDVVGPLGNPSQIENFGTVALLGGGCGIAAIFPIARALTLAGNKTISILGARNKDSLILEEEMRQVSSEVHIVTEDGSYGSKGRVTNILPNMFLRKESIDRVIAIGPLIMMHAIADLTRPFKIPTFVSMNPIMIDGTGMCGACRVMVGGEMKFACVDGPEFNGHMVDFDSLFNRLNSYIPEETEAKNKYLLDIEGSCKLLEKSNAP